MEFNIISREPLWLQPNKTYMFTYQEKGKAAKERIEMLYAGRRQYYFMEYSLKCKSWADDKESRDNFIKEIGLWSKGGSYRKTHPIINTPLEDLREKKENLLKQIREVENQLEKEKQKDEERRMKEYISDIDKPSLDKFNKELNDLIDKEYCLREVYGPYDIRYITVYDKKADKHRAIVKLYDDEINFKDLPDDLLNYLK